MLIMKRFFTLFTIILSISLSIYAQTEGSGFVKRVVMEEFTGTWCGFCPRGMVGIERLQEDFGDKIICIAVHKGNPEPMQIATYPDLAPGGLPSCMLDRGGKLDPYAGSGKRGWNHYGIDVDVAELLNEPAVAGVELKAQWADTQQWDIRLTTTTTFGFSSDYEADRYRLAFVLMEDGMEGPGQQWQQTNYFSHESEETNYTDDDMAFWRESPYHVSDMVYNHVPVNTLGIKSGKLNTISRPIVEGEKQEYEEILTTINNKVIQDKSRLYVVVMLIDTETGKILNANRAEIEEYSTNGINSLENGQQTMENQKQWYNLNGQRISKPYKKGIYIQNGKKTLINK